MQETYEVHILNKQERRMDEEIMVLFSILIPESEDWFVMEKWNVWFPLQDEKQLPCIEKSRLDGGNMWGNHYLGCKEISRPELIALADQYGIKLEITEEFPYITCSDLSE